MKSPAGLEALALSLRAPGSNRTVVVVAVVPTDYLATPSLALSFSLAWEWQLRDVTFQYLNVYIKRNQLNQKTNYNFNFKISPRHPPLRVVA